MPQAVAHILIPLLIASFVRDHYVRKKKRKIPLHYVLIAGVAGVIPDLDVVAFLGLHYFGFTLNEVHRTLSHTFFLPLLLLVVGLIFHAKDIHLCQIRKHKLHLGVIFYLLAFGSFMHVLLDGIIVGTVYPLYPLTGIPLNINLFGYLPIAFQGFAPAALDAGLLIVWLIYLELKHKISDFI